VLVWLDLSGSAFFCLFAEEKTSKVGKVFQFSLKITLKVINAATLSEP
jgi:hypothetical protein